MMGLAKVISGITGAGAGIVTGITGGAGGTGTKGSQSGGGATGAGGSASYMEKMIQAESGGLNIANRSGPGGTPTSTAFGIGQMLEGTFKDLANNAGTGNPLRGKTFDDYKKDVGLQREALTQFTDNNRRYLEKAGVSTTDAALYLAHFLGPGGAINALRAQNTAPIGSAVSARQLSANPHLQKMTTVGDLKQWADSKMGSGYRYGGVSQGPNSGYQAMLHGTEAIVPLPDGKSIPVEMPGFSANLMDQTSLMSQQLNKLDELVRVMQSQVGISNKILQRSN